MSRTGRDEILGLPVVGSHTVTCVVVKLGGHALDSLGPGSPRLVELALDIAQLRAAGTDVAIVHGGGPQILALLDALGMESQFHEGLRVTDTTTMRAVAMALAYVNLQITAALNGAGLDSVGLSGGGHDTDVCHVVGRAVAARRFEA